MNTDVYNHFERFDIEGDEGTQPNFAYGEHVEIPTTVINSPPPEEVQRAEEIPDHHGCKEARQDEQRQGPVKRKPRKQAGTAMDYEQTMIPYNIYKSWLQKPSDISRRRTKKKVRRDIFSTMKTRSLMELPPTIFLGGEVRTIPSSESGHGIPPFHAEVNPGRHSGSSDIISTMKIRSLMELPLNKFIGGLVRIIPSSESGHGIPPFHAEVNPGRSNKKMPYSSSRHSGSSLEPVAEEPTWQFTEPNFKISRLSENGPTPDHCTTL